MIKRMIIRNLKRFDDVEIPLDSPVVFIGPNNSGKTTALQALALWRMGVQAWHSKKGDGKSSAKQRVGVAINRRDLVQLPVPTTAMLWRNLALRRAPKGGSKATENILIEVAVEGISAGQKWSCAMVFNYANEDLIYCSPARGFSGEESPLAIPSEALEVDVAFLPPMSGLDSYERRIDAGAIRVSLGQGKTADVLRNLCYQVWQRTAEPELDASYGISVSPLREWDTLVDQMERLFGVKLDKPEYIASRGEIAMSYRESSGQGETRLDLSAAGRGFQQVLLLLAFLRWRPKCVLLIDEPDAHLEILRQSQIYRELCETAQRLGSSLVLATHSEVIMNEADAHQLVAFVGKPQVVRKTAEVKKALAELGFDQYVQAEGMGWVLYLEGSTDLSAMRILAQIACPEALPALERPFHHYVCNQPDRARKHFFGLREAFPNLMGIAVFNNSPDVKLTPGTPLIEVRWSLRELENYFCFPELLLRWVENGEDASDLFGSAELERRREAMLQAIKENTAPAALRDRTHDFWKRTKASEEYLEIVFEDFFRSLDLPVSINKSDYSMLARLLRPDEVHPEIIEVLHQIKQVHDAANARANG